MELIESILRDCKSEKYMGEGIYRVLSSDSSVIDEKDYIKLMQCDSLSGYLQCMSDYMNSIEIQYGSLVYIKKIEEIYGRVIYKVIIIETRLLCGCEEQYAEVGEYYADEKMLFGDDKEYQLILK